MNIRDRFNTALLGGITLLFGWGSSTLIHEICHIIIARSLGLPASLGKLTLTTGSVFVSGDMTNTETALVAVAGSIGLIIMGWLLTRASSVYIRMIGVIFLCRAFVDAIPISTMDGALIAGSVGYLAAWSIVIIEVLISGGIILGELRHPEVE